MPAKTQLNVLLFRVQATAVLVLNNLCVGWRAFLGPSRSYARAVRYSFCCTFGYDYRIVFSRNHALHVSVHNSSAPGPTAVFALPSYLVSTRTHLCRPFGPWKETKLFLYDMDTRDCRRYVVCKFMHTTTPKGTGLTYYRVPGFRWEKTDQ